MTPTWQARYTVALREGNGTWLFVADDLSITPRSDRCKLLTRTQANKVRKLFLNGAAKQGRPIEAKIIPLP
jgi:hypothetical protein